MSKTLLLLKLLQGHEVRNRSVMGSRQHVYATLQVNQEVEVRSTTARHGGTAPEFNQLFMLEMGPWSDKHDAHTCTYTLHTHSDARTAGRQRWPARRAMRCADVSLWLCGVSVPLCSSAGGRAKS